MTDILQSWHEEESVQSRVLGGQLTLNHQNTSLFGHICGAIVGKDLSEVIV